MTIQADEIQSWLDSHKVSNYDIICKNQKFLVNVNGDVDLKKHNLHSFLFQFGKVKGDFDCSQNQLTHLKGGPIEVKGEYNASNNLLNCYEGMPKKVGSLILNHNQLSTLSEFECFIREDFYLFSNPIQTIHGFPQFSEKASIILDKHFPFLAQYIENTQNKNFKMLTIDAHELMSYFENFLLKKQISSNEGHNFKDKHEVKKVKI
jgi:hypothetical protein